MLLPLRAVRTASTRRILVPRPKHYPSRWTTTSRRLYSTEPATATEIDKHQKNKKSSKKRPKHEDASASASPAAKPADHRKLGVQQELFMTSVYSPGSPIFLPNGARVFNRLVDFLRRQYVHYGFEEVITPNIYKKSLWQLSGHLENYADDMYTVTSRAARKPEGADKDGESGVVAAAGAAGAAPSSCCGSQEGDDDAEYGLKPMNCPGHCLIFASKNRSYRDLPIRYADFSPLHRNEVSGALSGLTRVRRFHQDDGHIFCRPSQVQAEVFRTLDFMRTVYGALGLGEGDSEMDKDNNNINDNYNGSESGSESNSSNSGSITSTTAGYSFALSTRPADHYIGTDAEWARAESQLRAALDQTGIPYTVKEGDGAFYGPKIDVMLRDSAGKTHQAGTVQLDFQLPQRFGLEYQAPAPEAEARGGVALLPGEEVGRKEAIDDSNTAAAEKQTYGPVTPVLIHRAVLGSVERLMALLIEECGGRWPFWLNPRQAVILTLNDTEPVVGWAEEVRGVLLGVRLGREDVRGGSEATQLQQQQQQKQQKQTQPRPTGFAVDLDASTRPLGEKLAEARAKNYGLVLVVGKQNVEQGTVSLNKKEKRGREDLTPADLLARMRDMVEIYQ